MSRRQVVTRASQHASPARRRSDLVVLAIVALLVAAALLTACGSGPSDASGGSSGAAAPLTGTTLAGQSYDLAAHKGRPVVVNFFASWCPPCNGEAPDLAAFARAHPEVDFVGVDVNDKQGDAQAFVAKYGLPYDVVYDPNGAVGGQWNVNAIPATFFIDKDGVVQDSIVGAADRATFESKLKSAL